MQNNSGLRHDNNIGCINLLQCINLFFIALYNFFLRCLFPSVAMTATPKPNTMAKTASFACTGKCSMPASSKTELRRRTAPSASPFRCVPQQQG